MASPRIGWPLVAILAMILVTAACWWMRREDGPSPAGSPPGDAVAGAARVTPRSPVPAEPSRRAITVEMPAPHSKRRVGEPIRVVGDVAVPPGYVLFQKKIYVGILGKVRGVEVLLASRLFPLEEVGGSDYHFDFLCEGGELLPERPGAYRLKLVVSDLEPLDGGDARPVRRGLGREIENRFDRIHIPFEVVP